MPAGVPLVIVTGLSGAGKSQALRALEDIGFYCVDNLPPDLLLKFAELCSQTRERVSRVALGIDIRGGDFFNSLFAALEDLEREGFDYEILFLEAQEDVLIRRFKETRRPHPLAMPGRLLDGIRLERERLQELRGRAQIVIDTSHKTPRELREEMARTFASPENRRLAVQLIPFGYKHGLPPDADLVIDVRFLPNPYYIDDLRSLTGNDPAVRDYLLKWQITRQFLRRLNALISFLLPHYEQEGKSQVNIAIGCTGGRHRSVVIANRLAELAARQGYPVYIDQRDMEKSEE